MVILFGIKRNSGGVKVKRRKKNDKPNYKTPADVKLFYIMPLLLIIGFLLVAGSQVMVHMNSKDYKEKILASSMQYGEVLPLWGGTASGVLNLGHTMLSKDGKTLAVEVKYDENAHQQLSSFGNRYKLRLVDTTDNVMNVEMTYGLFGTDGSGVLTIHSEKGFKDHAFIVMIIDNGQLVTTEDLQMKQPMNDAEIDKSITAQLSGANSDQTSSEQEEQKRRMPPLYYIRLNGKNATRSDKNWNNDRDLVNDLFVKSNLEKIDKQKEDIQKKIERGNRTLKEMEDRVKENPDDSIAQGNIQDLKASLGNLEESLAAADANIKRIKESTIKENVLAPKQKKVDSRFTISDLSQFE